MGVGKKGIQQSVFLSMASEEEKDLDGKLAEREACSSLALSKHTWLLPHGSPFITGAGWLAVQCKMDRCEAAVGLTE